MAGEHTQTLKASSGSFTSWLSSIRSFGVRYVLPSILPKVGPTWTGREPAMNDVVNSDSAKAEVPRLGDEANEGVSDLCPVDYSSGGWFRMKRTLFRRATSLGASPGLLYTALCNEANESATDGAPVAIRTWEQLGDDIGKSRRTAMRAAKKLQSCGLVLIMARRFNSEGQQVPNAFVLLSGEQGRRRAPDCVRLSRSVASEAFDLPPGYTVKLEYDEEAERYVVTEDGLVEIERGEGDTDDTPPKRRDSETKSSSSAQKSGNTSQNAPGGEGDTHVTPAKSGNWEEQSAFSGGKPENTDENRPMGEGDTDDTPHIINKIEDRESARAGNSSPVERSPTPAEEVTSKAVQDFATSHGSCQDSSSPTLFKQLVNVFRDAFRDERQFTFTRGWEETIEKWIREGKAPHNIPIFSKVLSEEIDACRVKGCNLNPKYLLEAYRKEVEQPTSPTDESEQADAREPITFAEALDRLDAEGKPKDVHRFYNTVETEDGRRFRRKKQHQSSTSSASG